MRLTRLLEAYQRERRLLAFEVHDGLVQHATAAHMRLAGLLPSLSSEGVPRKVVEKLHEVHSLISTTIAEARELISELQPTAFEQRRLPDAIEELLATLPAEAPQIRFVCPQFPERIDPVVAYNLYRMAQEGILNAVRHSEAERVLVRLSSRGKGARLEIVDNGIGFHPDDVSKRRFGLQGIRERARLLRGRVSISSTPGKGTRLRVDLPDLFPFTVGSGAESGVLNER